MSGILLTKYDGAILGPIANVLGMLMNGIFFILEKLHIPNIGFAIILFTIVVYLCMLPLTIKQQKFSKLSAKMNPELQEITKKYKGKKDNDSMMRMNQETQAVYKKYGVSQTGSCLQLLIQMPILFALYRVINNFPAYVSSVRDVFTGFIGDFVQVSGSSDFIQSLKAAGTFVRQFTNEQFATGGEYVQNTFIDVFNKMSTAEWQSVVEWTSSKGQTALSDKILTASETLAGYNNFLGLNVGNSPQFTLTQAWDVGNYLLVIGALLIPLLAALTQFINTKLMPQPNSGAKKGENPQMDTMASSMKMMNYGMPIMSAVFCFTLPTGMGLYWIAGAIVRSIQQIVVNRHLDKIDFDEVIKENQKKMQEKDKKKGIDSSVLTAAAKQDTKNKEVSYSTSAKPGSIAARANMVKEYNQKNNSK